MPRTKTESFRTAVSSVDATTRRVFSVPGSTTSILTEASKMVITHNGRLVRVPSFSLPARVTCPGAVIKPLGTSAAVCGGCYATKGSYSWSPTQQAQHRRNVWTRESLKTAEGTDVWVATMVGAITRATRHAPYFRVHDSGDMFSVEYADAWHRVCDALPGVHFWIPTRSYTDQVKPALREAMVRLNALPNVTVRPSALHVDAPAPIVPGLSAGTAVLTHDSDMPIHRCPAYGQGGACLDCQFCWDAPSLPGAYPLH